jgi:hypothetical protein
MRKRLSDFSASLNSLKESDVDRNEAPLGQDTPLLSTSLLPPDRIDSRHMPPLISSLTCEHDAQFPVDQGDNENTVPQPLHVTGPVARGVFIPVGE